jgi:hypothetical protein
VKTMAAVGTPLNSTMVVGYQTGLTPAGDPIVREKSLNDVRADATEQAIYDATMALFELTQHPVIDVFYRRNYKLVDE